MQTERSYREALLLLLRGTFGILDEYRLKLRIALRLPGDAEAYVRFLREMLFPRSGVFARMHARIGGGGNTPCAAVFIQTALCCTRTPKPDGDGVLMRYENSRRDAGTLCVSPRRFGVVTGDVHGVAALAEEFRRAAAAPPEIREKESC